MHTREKLPLGVKLSVNLNPNSQLPAIRARAIGPDLLSRNMSTIPFILVSFISKLLATGRARSFENVTGVKIEESTRRVDVDS